MADFRLTPQRAKTLRFYYKRELAREQLPTFAEIRELHGWDQIATAREHIQALGKHGKLERTRARTDPREKYRNVAWKLTSDGRNLAKHLEEDQK